MDKDTYYFSHDYNARNDKKIKALVKDHKAAGYGIFWATCEMMHEEGGMLEFDVMTIDAIASDINEDASLVTTILEACIEKYKLFTKHDVLLKSSRVTRNLETKTEKKKIKAEAGRQGGIKSGESRRNNNLSKQNEALLKPASSNEANKRKGNKRNEIKESKESDTHADLFFKNENFEESEKGMLGGEFLPPTWDEVSGFFFNSCKGFWDSMKCSEVARKFYNHFSSLDWNKTSGAPLLHWQSRAETWILEDRKGERSKNVPREQSQARVLEKQKTVEYIEKVYDQFCKKEIYTDAIPDNFYYFLEAENKLQLRNEEKQYFLESAGGNELLAKKEAVAYFFNRIGKEGKERVFD